MDRKTRSNGVVEFAGDEGVQAVSASIWWMQSEIEEGLESRFVCLHERCFTAGYVWTFLLDKYSMLVTLTFG